MASRIISDETLLEALDLYERKGWKVRQVALRCGVSADAMRGIISRCLRPIDEEGDVCTKPENRHGSQGPLWWRRG